jgi:hypothetical protein
MDRIDRKPEKTLAQELKPYGIKTAEWTDPKSKKGAGQHEH